MTSKIGIDIVEIKRVENLLSKFGKKALNRFLTQNEISSISSINSIAGYWAAKEAFAKAIGTGIGKECSFLDIEILKDEKGKPFFSKKTINKFNLQKADLSIAHDGGFAIAAVIVITKVSI